MFICNRLSDIPTCDFVWSMCDVDDNLDDDVDDDVDDDLDDDDAEEDVIGPGIGPKETCGIPVIFEPV